MRNQHPFTLAIYLLLSLLVTLTSCKSTDSSQRTPQTAPSGPISVKELEMKGFLKRFEYKTTREKIHSDKHLRAILKAGLPPVVTISKDALEAHRNVHSSIIVLDTSGSMRAPAENKIQGDIIDRIAMFLSSMEDLSELTLLNADGYPIAGWNRSTESDRGFHNPGKQKFLDTIRNYSYESQSDLKQLLDSIFTIHSETFTGEKTAVFIFGDEFTGDARTLLDDLNSKLQSTTRGELEINVVRAHHRFLVPKNDAALDVMPPNKYYPSYIAFEILGRHIASLTGGRFYDFQVEDAE